MSACGFHECLRVVALQNEPALPHLPWWGCPDDVRMIELSIVPPIVPMLRRTFGCVLWFSLRP